MSLQASDYFCKGIVRKFLSINSPAWLSEGKPLQSVQQAKCVDNIFIRMYFQDVYTLESHLNNDWPLLLKNLKQREDSLLELLQYNKRIISRQRSEDDELFVNDEISQHQQQLKKIMDQNLSMETEQKAIIEKYQGNIASEDQISKLMGRVGARVLQTCESSLDKCKSLDKNLVDKYYRMKSVLIKHINQKDNINLQQIIRVVTAYSQEKLNEELKKLQKLIKGLEEGEYQRLEEIYTPKPPQKPAIIVCKSREKSHDKAKVSSVGKEQKTPLKDAAKNQEKIRKQKQKLVTKMVNGLYSTMDLSRTQLCEDMCSNHKEKAKQLYNEIFSRNKFNHDQIVAFQAKEDSFHQKVRIFKEMMQKQSKKFAEVLISKPIAQPKKQNQELSVFNLMKHEVSPAEMPQGTPMSERKISNRYRIHSPKGRKEGRDLSGINMSAVQSTQDNFNHFKFDTSNQEIYARSNRNRLPQIPIFRHGARGTSLDRRIGPNISTRDQSQEPARIDPESGQAVSKGEKSKELRYIEQRQNLHRKRMEMKNIEVGVQGVIKKSDPIVHSKQRKKIDPNPMEYTFYVRKSGQKFYEPKHNIIF